jgi:hypothetical protein
MGRNKKRAGYRPFFVHGNGKGKAGALGCPINFNSDISLLNFNITGSSSPIIFSIGDHHNG